MNPVKTFTATIWMGLKEGYDGSVHRRWQVEKYLQERCDRGGLCVSVTDTTFIYKKGNEPGLAIGLINYPRYPSTPEQIRATALEIAGDLAKEFGQYRISVVMPDETITLEDTAEEKQARKDAEPVRFLGMSGNLMVFSDSPLLGGNHAKD